MTSPTLGWLVRKSAIRSALSQCRSIRTASVLSPRWVRKQSNGPGPHPSRSGGSRPSPRPRGRVRRARRPRRRSGRRRTWSCCARRCRRRAAAAAGGTAKRTCCRRPAALRPRGRPRPAPRCRRSRAAGWSGSRPRPAWSAPGRIAARTASTSSTGAGLWVRPHGTATLSKSRNVPPYASSGMTAWSPGLQSARSRVSSAASPEANAKPRSPSSTAASAPSRAVRVGLALRLYS